MHVMNTLKGYVTYYSASYARLQAQNILYDMRLQQQNMPRCHLRKYGCENGQTRGKNSRRTFVLTTFISFGLTDVFRLLIEPGWHLPLHMVPLAEKRFLRAGNGAESTQEKSRQCFKHDKVSLTTQSQ
jgi:hypothetical protein